MSVPTPRQPAEPATPVSRLELSPALANALGEERSARLRAIAERTGKPPEILIDIGLEFIELGVRAFFAPPLRRRAQQLASMRWENVTPEQRSEQLRRGAQARWAKHKSASFRP